MAPQVLPDQGIELGPRKDIPVRGEKDRPGDGPENDADVLERPAVVAHDDVRTLADKIPGPPDLDLLPQEKKRDPPLEAGQRLLIFLFKTRHGCHLILTKLGKLQKSAARDNVGPKTGGD